MPTILEKLTSLDNLLLLYKYNLQGYNMKTEKQLRNINAGVKINKADDEFLKMVSELNGDEKYMRSKTAYAMMRIGILKTQEELIKVKSQEDVSYFIEMEDKENMIDTIKIAAILQKHGLNLQVKKNPKEKEDETK